MGFVVIYSGHAVFWSGAWSVIRSSEVRIRILLSSSKNSKKNLWDTCVLGVEYIIAIVKLFLMRYLYVPGTNEFNKCAINLPIFCLKVIIRPWVRMRLQQEIKHRHRPRMKVKQNFVEILSCFFPWKDLIYVPIMIRFRNCADLTSKGRYCGDPQMTCTHGSWNTTDLFV